MGEMTAERLTAIVTPVVTEAGYDLEELKVSKAGRRNLVRLLVDRDGGVNLDAVAEVSRMVSAALDEAEETGGAFAVSAYTLEVSSPGVDRPLTLPRHWRRNTGRLVSTRIGDQTVTGRIKAVDDRGVSLEVAGETREVTYGDLGPGRIQLEYSRSDAAEDEKE